MNATSLRRQAIFWVCVLVFLVVFLILFHSILLPFVAGMALAYFLDPVADRLQRLGLSRLMATIVILVMFLVVFALALVIIVPLLVNQTSDFIQRLPGYVTELQQLVTSPKLDFLPNWLTDQVGNIRNSFADAISQGAGFLATLLKKLWNSGKALLDIIALFVVTPVVAFYMLLDWDRMVTRVDAWIPRQHLTDVRTIARDIDHAIAGFVRGQGSLCLILGCYYALGLTVVGLNFGLLIGFFAGLISFIPYIGSFIGLVLAIGVALVQYWPDYTMIALVAAVFFTGQFIEGNILQPKLVGHSVGLHPVWLMFALFAFGSIFGFVGTLIAVPASAAIAVLVRFALARYLESALYVGAPDDGLHPGVPEPGRRPGGKIEAARYDERNGGRR
ncbi:AI-2E family transporter [Pararhizobium mangrovi]|uniref:AI-2E family transporter n=1 Tax=Pararhizobium mangrovi TaxID=2590452 RepID=A0A506UEI4_9HYPH|nr:AI-2E family transporter [Pararhizobium mangrovi]TPW32068.1 AI-2E family transporter [Pararhizobium mangrovi]